jgi:hypothetical protein
MQSPVEPPHAEARTAVQGGVLKGPATRDRHILHSTRIDSPVSAFSSRFIWRGSRLRVRRSRGNLRSRNSRWLVPMPAGPRARVAARDAGGPPRRPAVGGGVTDQLDDCGRHPPGPMPTAARGWPSPPSGMKYRICWARFHMNQRENTRRSVLARRMNDRVG